MNLLSIFGLLVALTGLSLAQGSAHEATWPTYGGDPGGQRFSQATQIDRQNVQKLQPAWTFHTGALTNPRTRGRWGSFEATPILFDGSLYFASPYDEVFSLDPATGVKRWSYDPRLDFDRKLGIITSRAVASWSSRNADQEASTPCSHRIFLATLDARLIALDAATGALCQGFGTKGSIDLTQNVEYRKGDDYAVTSPATVVGDTVVVGAGIEDNFRVDVELGDVRGFDAVTGKLLWTWEPIPWAKNQKLRTGAANTWSTMAADLEHGLVYLPVSSPSPDYYGGMRPGDNRDADSIVALDAKTGKKVWAFQIIHHDIWDYDLASEPLLFTFHRTVPAIAIATKMGTLFVFNRLTGEPLYPVHERPVPASDLPGEVASPTQPFQDLPSLNPITLDLNQPLGANSEDDRWCRAQLAKLRYDGPFTPASMRGSLLYPSNVGGVNWGSTAFDPATGTLYANANRSPFVITITHRPWVSPYALRRLYLVASIAAFFLILFIASRIGGRAGLLAGIAIVTVLGLLFLANRQRLQQIAQQSNSPLGMISDNHFGRELGMNNGTPYALVRAPLTTPDEHPCAPQPWGTVSAVNLETAQSVWQTPLGTKIEGKATGTISVGGPIVTAGGLVFTAASSQPILRAYDSSNGKELWNGSLPNPAQATPMTYTSGGKQYIVVAAGGHPAFGTTQSDSLVAFALP